MYINLIITAVILIVLTIGFYYIFEKTKFKNLKKIWKDIIVGIFFGGLSVMGTELCAALGSVIPGASTANVRDAAPLIAGLLFSGPGGIIAGVIGGVERFCATYWGRGELTQWACSISTIIAGIYAYLLRRFLFKNKRPSWGFAIAISVVMEVFHLTLVFLTNITQPRAIMEIINSLAVPMIIGNVLAVTIPTLYIQILHYIKKKKEPGVRHKPRISKQVQWWLLGAIVVCYLASTTIVYAIQTNTAYQNADNTFSLTINDVAADVVDNSNKYMTDLGLNVLKDYKKDPYKPEYNEQEIMALRLRYNALLSNDVYKVGSIDVIKKDDKGTFLVSSTIEGFEDMSTFWMTKREEGQTEPGQAERIHIEMMKGTDVFVQEFGKRSDQIDPSRTIYSKYVAVSIDDNYYLAVCINEKQFYALIDDKVFTMTSHRHINENGHILVLNLENEAVSDESEYTKQGKTSGLTIQSLIRAGSPYERLRGTVYSEDCFYEYTIAEVAYVVVVIMPYKDIMYDRDSAFVLNSFMQVLTYAVLFVLIYSLIDKVVVRRIDQVNSDLAKITKGELHTKVEVNSSYEFESLSKDINLTVDALKRYIAEAEKRIDDELAFAKTIQLSALPSTFPAFPDKHQFELFATMNTAKEVGGDFYDFYIVDKGQLAFLIADVSGKGIPAAMFMMEGKAMIKNLAKNLLSPDEVLTKANESLAQNNEANMFITCWFGILDFNTGHVRFANAGHNAPLIYRKETNRYEYMSQKKSMVLGAFDITRYGLQEFDLKPGDKIYLYTDGVTEATRTDGVLYGESRLSDYLNSHTDSSLKDTLIGIKADIDVFIDGADQFDDITMLTIEYRGNNGSED